MGRARKQPDAVSAEERLQAQVELDRRLGKIASSIPHGPARERLSREAARKRGWAGLSAASRRLVEETEAQLPARHVEEMPDELTPEQEAALLKRLQERGGR